MKRAGIAVVLLAALWATGPGPVGASAPAFGLLHSFSGGSGGQNPNSTLTQGSDGFFYGTTSGDLAGTDHGTIFKVDSLGNFSIVHRFSGPDGDQPGGLIQAADGTFYGVTNRGGTGGCYLGCGTFFHMDSTGRVFVLHDFQGPEGEFPNSAIAMGSDGAFYGTTNMGGGGQGGTAFRIDTAGGFTLLHNFVTAEGVFPNGGLIKATDGNFYGVTNQYGPQPGGGGTVFRLQPSGALTVVHAFTFTDGYQPKSRLFQASDGYLYGTTNGGGPDGNGEVFKVSLAGTFQVVLSFDDYAIVGFQPVAELVQGPDGALYSTSHTGGLPTNASIRGGTIFRVDGAGAPAVLHSFSGPDGATPLTGLAPGRDGLLYGVAWGGGLSNLGTVFRLDPAAPLPVASLSFNPSAVSPGGSSTGTVVLSSPAPTGGQVVALDSDNPGAAQVPGTVTVPAGHISASFTATTSAWITGPATPRIWASVGGAGSGAILTVVSSPPPPSPPSLASLTLNPSVMKGGGASIGTVSLSATATGDVSVSLSSSRPAKAKVPSTVTVSAGSSSATFTVSASKVSRQVTVTISASLDGVTESAVLTLTR